LWHSGRLETNPTNVTHGAVFLGWNYNWQDEYYYERPFKLPAGTRITVEATFDNSDENPSNPSSPPRRVTWGDGTLDEMLFCFFLLTSEKTEDLIHVVFDNLAHDAKQPRVKIEAKTAPSATGFWHVAKEKIADSKHGDDSSRDTSQTRSSSAISGGRTQHRAAIVRLCPDAVCRQGLHGDNHARHHRRRRCGDRRYPRIIHTSRTRRVNSPGECLCHSGIITRSIIG
jgi:hypothetical protein